jgi:tryptophanyl-tRNA synthetase
MSNAQPRIFSGVQPTGDLHLGNYLGALRPWASTQSDFDNLFCVVDLHALTIPEEVDPVVLRAKSRQVAAMYMACGIDPERSRVFIQSHVREHSELAWVLNCVTPLGWLHRMTQYKSKSEQRDSVSTALLDYPVLQAADILLYDTQIVPVGQDQKQHIELARDIAVRFNHLFGETFMVPQPRVPTLGARVMGLDDPTQKMSKSVGVKRHGHAVNLLDSPKRIKKSIMGAKTDTGCEFRPEHASPGICNLIGIFAALSDDTPTQIAERYEGRGYGYLKKDVLETLMAHIAPIQAEYARFVADPATLEAVLNQSADRARETAVNTMERVRKAVGIG